MQKQYECNQCGHTWFGRKIDAPLACSLCKRYDWNEPKKTNRKKEVLQNDEPTN